MKVNISISNSHYSDFDKVVAIKRSAPDFLCVLHHDNETGSSTNAEYELIIHSATAPGDRTSWLCEECLTKLIGWLRLEKIKIELDHES